MKLHVPGNVNKKIPFNDEQTICTFIFCSFFKLRRLRRLHSQKQYFSPSYILNRTFINENQHIPRNIKHIMKNVN